MNAEITVALKNLGVRAGASMTGNDAMKFSQAALNLAHAWQAITLTPPQKSNTPPEEK